MSKKDTVIRELLLFLKGENGTGIPCEYSDLPTDPNLVIDRIKKKIVEGSVFRKQVIDSIILMSQDTRLSWFSLYYLYIIIRLIKVNKLPVDIRSIISEVEIGIKNFETELKSSFDWVGSNYDNGLWGDVERLSRNIFEEFSYQIYPQKDW